MINKKFLNEAVKMSQFSIDPNTQVGCVIVKDDEIVSWGCNCLPKGLAEQDYPLHIREGEYLDTKYPYVLHSEAMAIVNAKESLEDAILYVNLFPCNECAKLIIQAGIKKVYYLEDKYAHTDAVIAAKRMFDDVKIAYIELKI